MGTTPTRSWLGAARDDWFGHSVAAVGDVDGCGRSDLLIGAPYNNQMAVNADAAYLFLGEDPDVAAADFLGQSADAPFGWSIAGAGDLAGNDRSDVLVGGRFQASGGLAFAGRIYLFESGLPLSTTPMTHADRVATNDWFGTSVAGVPRFISEEPHAIIGGAPLHDGAAPSAGVALIFIRQR